ncbi:MAG: formate dehydrogenase accessory sulfurtransferase FdhD [Pseudomonadota bacterium]|nr:formate dehydrogenase accessory sulfurtransferase FdhD [Pseudomonadota bacterium]
MNPYAASSDLPKPSSEKVVVRLRDGVVADALDHLADEVPVALVYNGISHAVMMATPQDLEAFALGFSLTEAIIDSPAECYGIDVEVGESGIAVNLDIATRAFVALKERRRSLTGRTGCGLCGVDSLDQVYRSLPVLTRTTPLLRSSVIKALAALKGEQPLNRLTGATHAAAWCGADGKLVIVREDVGRHNALDKVIGAMARLPAHDPDGFMLISSRVSVEMAQKTAMAGVAALVAVSAPTAAAIRLAEGCGMTVIAFARGEDFVCYAHPAGLLLD